MSQYLWLRHFLIKVVYLAFFWIFMLLKMSGSKILAHRRPWYFKITKILQKWFWTWFILFYLVLVSNVHIKSIWTHSAPCPRIFRSTYGPELTTTVPMIVWHGSLGPRGGGGSIVVLWGQPIKLIQVVCASEFHEYWWKDVVFIFLSPRFSAGLQKPQTLTISKTKYENFEPKI